MIEIREEQKEDYDAVQIVNDRAFGTPEEGRIVNILREKCQDTLSLVAVLDGKIVGHIFFSPATIDPGDKKQVIGTGLAPMAVLPEHQKQGIGSLLVNEGIRRIKETRCPFILVAGHINYYPRFGFERASTYGLKCQWDQVPDEAFMIMVLDKPVMQGVSGVVKYRSEWNEAM